MGIKKTHSKYHEGHHLDRKKFLLGQNGALNMMLEDIMRAKKYVEDIGNIMAKNIFVFFQTMKSIRGQ
jgi:hypothetical protein